MRRLSIDADLDLTIDGHPVAVRGAGDRVVVAVDDARTAWRLFQSRRPGRHLVRAVTDTLDALGVDVEVEVGGRTLASAGPSAVRGAVTRALGLPALHVPTERWLWASVGAALAAGLWIGARR